MALYVFLFKPLIDLLF